MPRVVKSLVTLRPPVEVMRPVVTRTLPKENGLPGGCQYTIKLDGYRLLAFVQEDHRVILWSRRGTDFTERYRPVVPTLAELPVGCVLDGELIAVTPPKAGETSPPRIDFHALARTPEGRAAAGTQLLYVAFDLLAQPGRTITDLPLSERWARLSLVLVGARPPLQQCMATTSRREAMAWRRDLEPAGIEGICAKGWDTPYVGGEAPGRWVKVRSADTVDALIVGITGSAERPEAVLVQLPDGRQEVTSPRLDARQAIQVARAVAGRLRPAKAGSARVHWVEEPWPLVEVVAGSGRHATIRFVRIRPAE